MHVVVVIQCVQEIRDILAGSLVDFDKILGQVTHFRGDDVPSGGFQRLGNMVELLDLRKKARTFLPGGDLLGFEGLNFLSPRLDGVPFRVTVRIGMGGLDHAEVVEEEGHTARLAKRAGLEQVADFRCGAVPVVGQTFDDYGHLVGRKTFIDHGFVIDLFTVKTGAFSDGAFNGVPINGGLFRFLDGDEEARVQVGVGAAQLGRDHDFADQFGGHLAFFLRVNFAPGLFPLCAHRIEQFGSIFAPVQCKLCPPTHSGRILTRPLIQPVLWSADLRSGAFPGVFRISTGSETGAPGAV